MSVSSHVHLLGLFGSGAVWWTEFRVPNMWCTNSTHHSIFVVNVTLTLPLWKQTNKQSKTNKQNLLRQWSCVILYVSNHQSEREGVSESASVLITSLHAYRATCCHSNPVTSIIVHPVDSALWHGEGLKDCDWKETKQVAGDPRQYP